MHTLLQHSLLCRCSTQAFCASKSRFEPCMIQGIDSSSSAPSIAYSRSAWQQLVACHSELSRDASLVSRKSLLRYVVIICELDESWIFYWIRWPPIASAFVVSFETLEGEGGQVAEGGKGYLMELLKEYVQPSSFLLLCVYFRYRCIRSSLFSRKWTLPVMAANICFEKVVPNFLTICNTTRFLCDRTLFLGSGGCCSRAAAALFAK